MGGRRVIDARLVRFLRARYALRWRGTHGAPHWARVRQAGLLLCERTPGADRTVVELFAVIHDLCRENEGRDRDHGPRAAQLVEEIHELHLGIGREQALTLAYACRHHTEGRTDAPPTVQVCWDADRLDLGRVGIRPDPRYLCTPAARAPAMIDWAWRRTNR